MFDVFSLRCPFALSKKHRSFSSILDSKATTPVFTIVVMVCMGIPYDKWLLLPVAMVIVGCCMCVDGTLNVSVIGTVFLFLSAIGPLPAKPAEWVVGL